MEKLNELRRLKEEKEEVIRLLCEKLRKQTELEYDVALIKLEFQDEETMELADLELLDTALELIYGEILEATEFANLWFIRLENLSFKIDNI